MLVLSKLDEIEGLTSKQLNRIAILHYRNKSFFESLKYWERDISVFSGNYYEQIKPSNTNVLNLFNLGVAYSNNEISQDADAIDIWRLAKQRSPNYEKAQKNIEKLLPRLVLLRKEALKYKKSLLKPSQYYQQYINPFELIGVNDNEFDNVDKIETKTIQKLKKVLLQEIELENGQIEWMDGLELDRSKAISICDTLNDSKIREFHWQVFTNKPLLAFLSKGDHEHFTVDHETSPLDTLEFLYGYGYGSGSGFREFLSPMFSKQYDIVLSLAISKGELSILEVLLDGRRWINSSYTDQCFNTARQKIDILLEGLLNAQRDRAEEKHSLAKTKEFLESNSLLKILNLCPTFFWEQQNKAVAALLDIAVSSYNDHGDPELSKSIIEFSKKLVFKSAVSNKRISENYESINQIIVLDELLDCLDEIYKNVQQHKPSVRQIEKKFKKETLEILNQSPVVFENKQDQAVQAILAIAVSCYNDHDDAELSKKIIEISNKFCFKSAELTNRIDENYESINQIIKSNDKSYSNLKNRNFKSFYIEKNYFLFSPPRGRKK